MTMYVEPAEVKLNFCDLCIVFISHIEKKKKQSIFEIETARS